MSIIAAITSIADLASVGGGGSVVETLSPFLLMGA